MKKLYTTLSLSFLCFAGLVSYYTVKQQRLKAIFRESGYEQGPYGEASFELAIISLFFIAFAIGVAIGGIQRLKKTSKLLLGISIPMGIWSLIMASSPRHISVDEVAIAWYAYIVLSITLASFGAQKIDSVPIPIKHQEDILDDL
ncbi:MAG: hypothetical protein GY810_11510 [Aureispira sp.]|nr:hypothetical protein [Aureispira sp.]